MALKPHRGISSATVALAGDLRLFSYVVARDYGFAPNPFYGVCTLATCKPGIRKKAVVGDWIIGTGSKKQNRHKYLVYAMRVTDAMVFNKYWGDSRFQCKKPNLRGSLKQAYGDNIYFKKAGKWHQLDSHHSYEQGKPNPHNIQRDTQTDRVLLSTEFVYWGGSGPRIPQEFLNYSGMNICAIRGYKTKFPLSLTEDFVMWLLSLDESGYLGEPLDWSYRP